MDEIKCIWWNEMFQIGITEKRDVYALVGGEPVKLKEEFHMNRPHWRIPKTSKRFSDLMLNKMCKKQERIIQQYCPF